MRKLIYAEIEVAGKTITVNASIYYSIDLHYGEDADGNRGEKRILIKQIRGLQAYGEDGKDFILLQKDKEAAEEKLVEKFLEE